MKNHNIIVQSLFSYGELNNMHRLSMRSFIENGHRYHLYTYGGVKNIPNGVILKDANEIIPEALYFTTNAKSFKGIHAPFSDLFRYKLLLKKGGWWVDTDVVCLKPFDIDQERLICSVYHGKENKIRASNFVLKFPADDPFIKKVCQISEDKAKGINQYEEIGPILIRKLIESENEQTLLAPYYYFSPVSWYNTQNSLVFKKATFTHYLKSWLRPIIRPNNAKAMKLHKESFGVHLWGEVWRSAKLDGNDTFSKKCIFEKLKITYPEL